MRRAHKLIVASLLALVGTVPPAALAGNQEPSGDYGSVTSTAGQQIQSNFPGAIPEETVRSNWRSPNVSIFGGDQTVNDWSNGANPWANIPAIILRPFGKRVKDSLDTLIKWTTPAAARTYTIADAGGNDTFAMLAATQTFTNKTLTSPAFTNPTISGAGAGVATLIYANSSTSRTITFPDPGGADSVDYLAAAQTISGVKTYTAQPVMPSGTTSTKGIGFAGVTNGANVVMADQAAPSQVYTIPDSLASASFVMTAGAQTIGGVKTFSAQPVFKSGTTSADGIKINGATNGANIVLADQAAPSQVYTIPDSLASASFVMTQGAQTIAGAKTFSSPPTITGGLTAANIQTGSAKRELLRGLTAPAGGAVTVNGTTYFANLAFGRAGVVKKITYMTHVDPVSGTNTIKVLKNGSAGNTMLSTASVSLNGSTADTAQTGTLTGTGADLTLTATDTIYCEYAAGTQGSVAKDVNVVVEFEPTDF